MSLHWAMANCFLLMFVTGIVMPRLPEDLFFREPLYGLHKSVGVLLLGLLLARILVLLRVSWSKYTRRLPKATPAWLRVFVLHSILYLLMLVAPLSGLFLSNSYESNNVPFFGLKFPDIFPVNEAVVELARSLHFWLTYTFLAFIVLHVANQWQVVRATWRRAWGAVKSTLLAR
ncbi:cytochrome b/b6 domain-containing protein [Leptolyngbya sp. FACHB-261]|nr:cytochrome b/b6 domain-containing protein [Leptolyngbya sp. FACHB-261]